MKKNKKGSFWWNTVQLHQCSYSLFSWSAAVIKWECSVQYSS